MLRNRSVKIVATLGPSSTERTVIRSLFEAGADVFRLNMSHGTHDDIAERHRIIRDIEIELDRPICILADLQGPKLRVGTFANGPETLEIGQKFRFDMDEAPGSAERVMLKHPEIFEALTVGSTLLVNDGKLRFRVLETDGTSADCEVEVGGEISDRKGVNVPDVELPLTALSEKDRSDLDFALSIGVDWVALSFVQRPEDVLEAKDLIKGQAAVMAKIEKPSAVSRFDDIVEVVDGIMLARGDLGVELPVQELPPIQKRLVRRCRELGKPVIVATQMLESMISSPVPTRAEVSDVATAIYEGADAVMLSGESAAGQYPIEAVQTMDAVAQQVEADPNYRKIIEAARTPSRNVVADAITLAAREVAETTDVKTIACFTHSGTTAIRASRERPSVRILSLTPKLDTARKLSLVWGLHCVVTPEVARFKHAVVNAARAARMQGLATEDDRIVVTAGIPFNVSGSTNILRVAPVKEKLIFEGEPE